MPNDHQGFHPKLGLESAISLAWETYTRRHGHNPDETNREYWDLIFFYVYGEYPKQTTGSAPGVRRDADEEMVRRGDHDPRWEELTQIKRVQRAEREFRDWLLKTPP